MQEEAGFLKVFWYLYLDIQLEGHFGTHSELTMLSQHSSPARVKVTPERFGTVFRLNNFMKKKPEFTYLNMANLTFVRNLILLLSKNRFDEVTSNCYVLLVKSGSFLLNYLSYNLA